MPWWVTPAAFLGPAIWAMFLLWRVEVWKRRADVARDHLQATTGELTRERATTAELRLQLSRSGTAMSYLKDQITQMEGELDASATAHPGDLRERWRERLRSLSGGNSAS